ncbi:hypothetical protein HDZ31DRAFT_76002 [Schizophyllum fasciatum]
MASQPPPAPTDAPYAMHSAAPMQPSGMPPSLETSTAPIGASTDPASSAHKFTHLPTPQSPNNWGPYMFGLVSHPPSPVTIGSSTPYSPLGPSCTHRPLPQSSRLTPHMRRRPLRPPSSAQQPMTPDASPLTGRKTPPRNHFATPQFIANGLESPISIPPSKRTATPNQALNTPDRASPFMARLAMADRQASSKSPQTPHHLGSLHSDDVFASSSSTNPFLTSTPGGARPPFDSPSRLSSPPTPPPINADVAAGAPFDGAIVGNGGELQRIRQAEMEQQMAQYQEAESRRPEYLVRTKRSLDEVDPAPFDEASAARERNLGIHDSPSKGRRIKLFQETSEESFEESLMAGGYGRYRTADWVRAPQPIPPLTQRLTPTPAVTAAPDPSAAENTDPTPPPPPTEKELRKRKRLAAFAGESPVGNTAPTKLVPVELAGRGRVLLDVPPSALAQAPASPAAKRAPAGRRRKKPEERRTLAATVTTADVPGGARPAWPDGEFPWRLRAAERAAYAAQEAAERLKWIERFLDRESDEEDGDGVAGLGVGLGAAGEDEEILPSATWGQAYEDSADRPMPPRRGRGKMVPLHADPAAPPRPAAVRSVSFFPSDPGDARAALLAKKSVRALSFRRSRARAARPHAPICVCRGRAAGNGSVVQCDGCRTWYHLRCIGVRRMAELGKEEDAWFCERCVDDRSVSEEEEQRGEAEALPAVYAEPTFVPTDARPLPARAPDDAAFFPAVGDSPAGADWQAMRVPRTPPPRGGALSDADLTSSSAWSHSGPPTTPRQARFPTTPGVFMRTPNSGLFEAYDESFDPMSTPSRGMPFAVGAAAAAETPKGGPGLLWAAGRGLGATPRPRPVQSQKPPSGGGRVAVGDKEREGRRGMESPAVRSLESPSMRSLSMLAQASVDESPIVRSARADRRPRAQYD